MKFRKGLLCAALSLGALAAATPASAQRVDRIVAFGDSYADDGNLFQLLGIPRPAVYPNGRFSDGTNFVDTMSQLLGVPVDNFAIGGAFTGNGNINGPGIPGFVTEYQSFLAGGGPAAFPRVSGTFGPNDLLVISIGGNDARAYERSLGLNPSAAQISGLIAGAPAQAAIRVDRDHGRAQRPGRRGRAQHHLPRRRRRPAARSRGPARRRGRHRLCHGL